MSKPSPTFRVWHNPQMPSENFETEPLDDIGQAIAVQEALSQYDLFLLENNHRVDFANANGIEVLDNEGEWTTVTDDEAEEWAAISEDEPVKRQREWLDEMGWKR